jgi:transposase
VPIEGVPRLVEWHRQHYRCLVCGRASNEESPEFEKERFITRRFADWVIQQSKSANLASIAKQAGMNQVVMRRLFHSLSAPRSTDHVLLPRSLGIAMVKLAGSNRPALADIETCAVLDVFGSMDELKKFLEDKQRSISTDVSYLVRDIEFDTAEFLAKDRLRDLFPDVTRAIISSRSLARAAVAAMIALCEPWIKATAAAERRSPISVRKLFARRDHDLKQSASRRVRKWQGTPEANALFQAYDLKERFIGIWLDEHDLKGWRDWISRAEKLPEQRFQEVIAFIESKWNEVTPCFEELTIVRYERWLEDVQKYEIRGTHSFAATRLALLKRFERPSEFHLPYPSPLSEEDEIALASISNMGASRDENG